MIRAPNSSIRWGSNAGIPKFETALFEPYKIQCVWHWVIPNCLCDWYDWWCYDPQRLLIADAINQITKAMQMAATLSSIRGDTDFGRSGTLS